MIEVSHITRETLWRDKWTLIMGSMEADVEEYLFQYYRGLHSRLAWSLDGPVDLISDECRGLMWGSGGGGHG